MRILSIAAGSFLLTVAAFAGLVDDTRAAMAAGNFPLAERIVEQQRSSSGKTPEFAQAVSWLARGALALKNYERADSYASEARQLAVSALGPRRLDSDPVLQGAIGNAIDVHAQVLNARGDAAAAVAYLRSEFATYGKTAIAERIQKTVNVISLEGQPAPALGAREWIGAKPPTLASMKGRPVLLFFWAHWCPDCKAEAPVIAKIMQTYGSKGLALMAPTRYYGYTAANENATPQVEKPYIEKIQKQYYAALGNPPTPVSNADALTWGMASTPTLALVDRAGIVRWYHPGNATEQEIAARVEAALK
jgi:thiol-disulfide isomerase/thioredoxin